MSKLYCFAVHENGIFMIGDTMLTTPTDDGGVSFTEGFHKVLKLSDNILFGMAGDMSYADIILQHIEYMISLGEYRYPEEISRSLSLRYGRLRYQPKLEGVDLMIAGYSQLNFPQIFLLLGARQFSVDDEVRFNARTHEMAGFWRTIGLPGCENGFDEDIKGILSEPHSPNTRKLLLSRAEASIHYFSANYKGVGAKTDTVSILYHPSCTQI